MTTKGFGAAVESVFDAAIAGDPGAIYELNNTIRTALGEDYPILHKECKNGNIDRIRYILREFEDYNILLKLDENKNSALVYAAYAGQTEVVEFLIESARHLNSSSSAKNDDENPVDYFQTFIRQANKKMYTALHAAVLGAGSLAVVKLLVEADPSDRHVQNVDGETPIYMAAEKGLTDILKVILTTCTAPSSDGPYGTTALHGAIKSIDQANENDNDNDNDNDIVEVLIDAARRLPFSSAAGHGSDNQVSSFQDFVRKADEFDNTALHKAVINRNVDIVKLLVEADPSYRHTQNNLGKTPIYIAAEEGYTDIIKVIVRACTNLCFDGPKGATAFHRAVKKGQVDIVKLLVEADPSNRHVQNKKGKTPIYIAAEKGNLDIVKVLCTTCTNLSSDGPRGSTALHAAVMKGHVGIVKLLVEADPSGRHIQNDDGETPLYIAVKAGYIDIVKVIFTTCTNLSFDGPNGANVLQAALKNLNQGRAGRETAVDVVIEVVNAAKPWCNSQEEPPSSIDALFYKTDDKGKTVLDFAVEGNYEHLVWLILKEDPAYRHGWGRQSSIIQNLIYVAAEKGYSNILNILCETYEAGISHKHKGLMALVLAIRQGHTDSVLQMLGDAKHLAACADHKGWTPLHFAADNELDWVLDAIIQAQKEFEFNYVYEDGILTPLHVAAEKGHTSTMIQLMQLCPPTFSAYAAVNGKGRNILHVAADKSRKEMIQAILKHCPETYMDKILNVQDVNGDTPLHLLISNGCFIPELLKHKRLNTMAKNNQNRTPLDMFYLKKEIEAEQVQIKIALDDIQNDHHLMFWRRNQKKKLNILESKVLPSERARKDVEFKKAKKLFINQKRKEMEEEVERYKTRTNIQIIVTALITTVTFTVGFTMPGGLHQSGEIDQGLAILSNKRAFNAFMVSDALALLLSTTSLFLYFLESMYEDPKQVEKLDAASTSLNIVSVVAMMLTFITGTYVVLSHSPALAISVCVIGSLFFLLIIIFLIMIIYDRRRERDDQD